MGLSPKSEVAPSRVVSRPVGRATAWAIHEVLRSMQAVFVEATERAQRTHLGQRHAICRRYPQIVLHSSRPTREVGRDKRGKRPATPPQGAPQDQGFR